LTDDVRETDRKRVSTSANLCWPEQRHLFQEKLMSANVFRGKVARVDLSTGQVQYEKVRDEDARLYIGARGLGVKYVQENGPDVEPFSAENVLALSLAP